ncbi:hypothetical protein [Amycolatopsis plumensis]|uniref:Uncharacterized protein n=1 Tax=Amycolatopsis plumensis TaxID=236508 RepID=A0ABV5U3Y1_9PSEU
MPGAIRDPPGIFPAIAEMRAGNRFFDAGKAGKRDPPAGRFSALVSAKSAAVAETGRVGEEKGSPGDERPKRDDGEPTPIFDAVFDATRAQANTPNPPPEPGKAER